MRLLAPAAGAALIVTVALSATMAARADGAGPSRSPLTGGTATEPDAGTTGAHGVAGAADRRTAVGPSTIQVPRRGFVWPLSPRPEVLHPFVQPRSQWSAGHRGVDLRGTEGQPVLGSGDGIVAFSGVIAGRGVITVRHAGGLRTTYEPVDQRLASGSVVHRGEPIGVLSFTSGHCAPLPCLHWGAITGRGYVDPLSLLGIGRPILLPLG